MVAARLAQPPQRLAGAAQRRLVARIDLRALEEAGELPRPPGLRRPLHGGENLVEQSRPRAQAQWKAQGLPGVAPGAGGLARIGRHVHDEIAVEIAPHVPLQRVAEIDRHRDSPLAGAQRLPEREEHGDAREDHGHGMHVDAADPVAGAPRDLPLRHIRCAKGLRLGADRVEEEGPRAAGRIEHALVGGIAQRLAHHAKGEPIGSVVLAELVALGGIDEGLVEHLQEVDVDVAEIETIHVLREPADEIRPVGRIQNPAEQVVLHRAGHADIGEGGARQEAGGLRRRQIGAHHAGRDRLGDDHEIGVLQPQEAVVHRAAVDMGEVALPELALELRLRVVGERREGALEQREAAGEGGALAAELARDRERIGPDAVLHRDDALEPGEERARLGRPRARAGEFGEGAVAQLVGDEGGAVRRDADVARALRSLALGEIARELRLGRAPLAAQIGLDLEERAPEQRIDPPRAHLAHDLVADGLLEEDLVGARAEPLGEELEQEAADLLVTRARRQFADDVRERFFRQRHDRPRLTQLIGEV